MKISDMLSYGEFCEYYKSDLKGKEGSVYRKCADVLRKQGWNCNYKFGSTLQAEKEINGNTRTLDLEVTPTTNEIELTRDNSSAPIRFKSPQELAIWLPKNIDKAINYDGSQQSSVPENDFSMPSSMPDLPSLDSTPDTSSDTPPES